MCYRVSWQCQQHDEAWVMFQELQFPLNEKFPSIQLETGNLSRVAQRIRRRYNARMSKIHGGLFSALSQVESTPIFHTKYVKIWVDIESVPV